MRCAWYFWLASTGHWKTQYCCSSENAELLWNAGVEQQQWWNMLQALNSSTWRNMLQTPWLKAAGGMQLQTGDRDLLCSSVGIFACLIRGEVAGMQSSFCARQWAYTLAGGSCSTLPSHAAHLAENLCRLTPAAFCRSCQWYLTFLAAATHWAPLTPDGSCIPLHVMCVPEAAANCGCSGHMPLQPWQCSIPFARCKKLCALLWCAVLPAACFVHVHEILLRVSATLIMSLSAILIMSWPCWPTPSCHLWHLCQ